MTSSDLLSLLIPLHGGPDAEGSPAFDFSTNSNACGPCPNALRAVQLADAARYPDPAYTALRAALGAFHRVDPGRVVLAASASEFIHRITALAAAQGVAHVAVPLHSYGDYAQAAELYRAALGKAGVDKDLANLRLGMTLARSGDKAGATAALNAAGGAQAEVAKLWLTYLATKA